MLRVVAGVIKRGGDVLIGQRPPGKSHAFEWEFPGGKVEPGEALADALARELGEELGIEARIGREIMRYRYAYAGKTAIELIFFEIAEFTGEPVNRVFHRIRWVAREELSRYPFLEGDRALLELLTSGSG